MYLKIEYILYKIRLKRGEFYVIIWRCVFIYVKNRNAYCILKKFRATPC